MLTERKLFIGAYCRLPQPPTQRPATPLTSHQHLRVCVNAPSKNNLQITYKLGQHPVRTPSGIYCSSKVITPPKKLHVASQLMVPLADVTLYTREDNWSIRTRSNDLQTKLHHEADVKVPVPCGQSSTLVKIGTNFLGGN